MNNLNISAQSIEEALAMKAHAMDLLLQQRHEPNSTLSYMTKYTTLKKEIVELERISAEKRGEPYAIEWSIGDVWNGMANYPIVIGDHSSCTAMFVTKKREHAVLGFQSAAGYKLTAVNDEIIRGHPLSGKGLMPFQSFRVMNSLWIKEVEAVAQTHPKHMAERWKKMQHYLLSFKDRMFEVLALDARLLGSFISSAEAIRVALDQLTPETHRKERNRLEALGLIRSPINKKTHVD